MHAQRWRLIVARAPDAPDLPQRDLVRAWEAAASAFPAAGAAPDMDGPKVVIGAPAPAGMAVDADLADLFLPVRLTVAEVRATLHGRLPAGWSLVDLHDVWVGEPALPGLVAAADYRVRVGVARPDPTADAAPDPSARSAPSAAPDAPDPAELAAAVATVLGATTIDRARTKPGRAAGGNLRPLIVDIRVEGPAELWMRLRLDPVLGTGRPEEVVTALGLVAGRPFVAVERRRERLWLRDETPAAHRGAPVGV